MEKAAAVAAVARTRAVTRMVAGGSGVMNGAAAQKIGH